jgi:hypothetical protein
MDDLTFEQQVLGRFAPRVAYPATPALGARVLAAIAEGTPAPSRPTLAVRRRALVLASIIALAVAIVGALAVPQSRGAIADFFGVQGSKIEILPTPAPGVTPTPFPTPAGIQWIATPTSLDGARSAAGFEPALPPGQGEPLGVYLVDYGRPPVVVLQYARFDLWESRTVGFFVKGVPEGVTVHDRTVNGHPATWIGDGEHIVRFADAEGQEVAASVRTVDRGTLIWSSGDTFFRLETDLTEEEAARMAESLP